MTLTDMGVYLCGFGTLMSEQFLYISQISTGFQQVSSKRMPESVNRNIFLDAGFLLSLLKYLLYGSFVQMTAWLGAGEDPVFIIMDNDN